MELYEHQKFPKWKYHAVKEAVIVESEAGEKALGKGWVDSPADVKVPSAGKEASAKAAAGDQA